MVNSVLLWYSYFTAFTNLSFKFHPSTTVLKPDNLYVFKEIQQAKTYDRQSRAI